VAFSAGWHSKHSEQVQKGDDKVFAAMGFELESTGEIELPIILHEIQTQGLVVGELANPQYLGTHGTPEG
jgi:hypothetical protein